MILDLGKLSITTTKVNLSIWKQIEKVYSRLFNPEKAVEWPDNYFKFTTPLWNMTGITFMPVKYWAKQIINEFDLNIIEYNWGNQIISGESLT